MPPNTGIGESTLGLSKHQRRPLSQSPDLLGMNIQHPPCTPKSLIPASKIHGSDAILPQHTRTHDAWLDSNVEVGLFEDGERVGLQDAGNGDEFGVACAIERTVCFVTATSDNGAISHEDTANRRLVTAQRELGLGKEVG